MRKDDFLKGETLAVENCPVRDLCPIGTLCSTCGSGDTSPLFPNVIEVEKGAMLWADLRSEQRVYIVRKGVFSCLAHLGQSQEMPFALYGAGTSIGLPELYIPRSCSDTYHLQAIFPGRACSLPAKTLRHHLEDAGEKIPPKVLSTTLVNLSSAMHIQSMITYRPTLVEKIAGLLMSLQELARRSDPSVSDTLPITHEEIASLLVSDRASVTRALHKMEQDGLVSLGYRTVTITDALKEANVDLAEACDFFFNVEQ